jgi:hypothetical protein
VDELRDAAAFAGDATLSGGRFIGGSEVAPNGAIEQPKDENVRFTREEDR